MKLVALWTFGLVGIESRLFMSKPLKKGLSYFIFYQLRKHTQVWYRRVLFGSLLNTPNQVSDFSKLLLHSSTYSSLNEKPENSSFLFVFTVRYNQPFLHFWCPLSLKLKKYSDMLLRSTFSDRRDL